VEFLGKDIPYWQQNGQVKYPNVRDNFVQGLRQYVSENKDGMVQSLNMPGTELGIPNVNANFLSDKIVVTVNMPTKIDGQSVSKPYIIEVATNLAEVDEFSRGFAIQDANIRILEYCTLNSMGMSPIEDGVHAVPFFVFLTECDEFVFKSWWDMQPNMDKIIKTTLANTYMPGKVITHKEEAENYPQYTVEELEALSKCESLICAESIWARKGVPFISKELTSPQCTLIPVNNKRYEDLDVSFHLPDDFELTHAEFQFSPDPIVAVPKVIPFVGECQSDPFYVNYYVSYPAVVRVKDSLTNNVFNFAVHVYIKDNKPGQWAASVTGYDLGICNDMQCSARVAVRDSSGRGIDYAYVSFMGCSLGKTDENGVFSGPAPCGIGPLEVYKEGFGTYKVMESSDTIDGIPVSLVKTPVVNLHFYQVIIQNLTLSKMYDVAKSDVKVIGEDQNVFMNFFDIANDEIYQRGFKARGGQIRMMPTGDYVVGGTLFSGASELGAFLQDFTLSEDFEGKDLYIYLPNDMDYGSILDTADKTGAMVTLTNVLRKCGLGPISTSEIKNFNGCSVGYDEV
jgi:hypothetical protein